jgi:EAL domain-containing protein (putative c-di-GMP-specific phosphodiesterase class I)
VRHADHAMYEAKLSGKNRYHFFDAVEDRRISVFNAKLQRIEQALDDGELELFFQPKIDLLNGRLVGAEALVRWRHPKKGILPPSEFLPLITETELEINIGKWVISTALAQQQRWLNDGLNIELSINVSPNHIQLPDFVNDLKTELKKHPNLPKHCIQMEVLETAALKDINSAMNTMNSCSKLGIHFALDDFGTGYSSLTHLCKLPVSTIKIDQTFIREMLHDDASMAVVVGIIALAKSFTREIVAEGIETPDHLDKLAKLGCNIGQGYAIAHPMSADRFWQWAMHQLSSLHISIP